MLLALFLIIQSPAGAGQLTPGERLEYTFSYQGIFTGYISMKIAHAEFAIQPTVVIIKEKKRTALVSAAVLALAGLLVFLKFLFS